jgi:signal peptidase II
MEGAGGNSVVVNVVPAKAGTHNHRRSRSTEKDDPKSFKQYTTRRMGPRFRGDDVADCFGHRMTSRLRPGIIAALAVLALDQASKLWLLFVFDLPHRGAVKVTPFLDLVLAWNVGISFGWFQSNSQIAQIILMIIKAVAVIVLAIWMARSRTLLATVALGLIIGGAIGNAIDRFAYGAVVDFALFHLQIGGNTFNWYVFNLADVAIVAGVAALLYDSFLGVPAAKAP